MINEKYIELMNKEIDKVITPEERIELQNYLSKNNAAKNYYDELLLTNDFLDRLPDHNPPENLKKQIINSIDFSRYEEHPEPVKKSAGFLWGLKFRYAYIFAAGLLAGIIIFSIFYLNTGNVNTKEISGTIGAGNIRTLQEIQLNFSDISGKIELKERNNTFWFDISAFTPQNTYIIISYPNEIKFENITPGSISNIELSRNGNYIKITNSGSQQYSLQFSQITPASSPMYIRILQSGNVVYEHELSLKQ
ncbi:MAG TPA: hypothetical protein VLB50_00135 [Ignavibacteriaceae bacterium]|nr:hypothetical protein [Ignavibacteriaceae bacterium]